MNRKNVSDLIAFITVARGGSFTKAGIELGVSQPALSHSIKELERRLGVRLLNRTTRSVSTTQAGEELLRTIIPHFEGIEVGLSVAGRFREKPAGTVRITTGDYQAEAFLLPALTKLLSAYPDLNVEISINLGFVDIVADRFDAGVRLGETIAQDMISVRIGPDMCMAVVAAPAYFEHRLRPITPHDLADHNCIGLRYSTDSGIGMWEFEKAGRSVNVRVEGQLVVNSVWLQRSAALDGVGLAYLPENYVGPAIASGALVRVLADWCEPFPGFHLYYPSRRQPTSVFQIVVEALRH